MALQPQGDGYSSPFEKRRLQLNAQKEETSIFEKRRQELGGPSEDSLSSVFDKRRQELEQQMTQEDQPDMESQPKSVDYQQEDDDKDGNWFMDSQEWLYDKTIGPAQNAVTRFASNMVPWDVHEKLPEDSPDFIKETTSPADTKSEKVLDVTGNIAGYAIPYGAAYKGVKALGMGAKAVPKLGQGASRAQKLGRIAKQAGQYAKEGAAVGLAGSTGIEAAQEIANPESQTFGERAKDIGMETAFGAVGDPAIMGVGSAIKRGLKNSKVRELIDSIGNNKQQETTQKTDPYNVMNNPFETKLNKTSNPNYSADTSFNTKAQEQQMTAKKTEKNQVENIAQDAVEEFRKEMDNQLAYMKQSSGNGVEPGGLIRNDMGEVVDRFPRISNNAPWYSEFYRKNGRAPNKKESEQLAKEQLLEGFTDTYGEAPSWKPSALDEFDEQLDELEYIREQAPSEELDNLIKEVENRRNAVEEAIFEKIDTQTGITPSKQKFNLKSPKQYKVDVKTTANKQEPIDIDAELSKYDQLAQEAAPTQEKPSFMDNLKDQFAEGQDQFLRGRFNLGNQVDNGTIENKVNFEQGKEKESFREKILKWQNQFIDDTAPIRDLEENITGQKVKDIDAKESLYKAARRYRGVPEKAHLFVRENYVPIIQNVEKQGYDYKDLAIYSSAKHAKDLEAKGINSGFESDRIQKTIEKFEGTPLEDARQRLLNISRNQLKQLENEGVIEKGTAQLLADRHPNYMPMSRDMSDIDNVGFGSRQGMMTNASSPIKNIEGSNRDVIDPIESMVKNSFKTIQAVERNRVTKQLAKLAEKDPDSTFLRKLEPDEQVAEKNVVRLMENGEPVRYEVPSEIYKTMMNLDKEGSNLLIRLMQKPASWLRAGATLDPVFAIRNPIRDVLQAGVVSDSGFNPFTDFWAGLYSALKKDDLYKDFIENGGGFGNVISMDRNYYTSNIKKGMKQNKFNMFTVVDPRRFMELLRAISDTSETATKLGEFRAATKKAGVGKEEAAYRARDIMDFSRAGVSTREANKVIAFLNANIQGKSKLYRAFKDNPTKVSAKALTTGVLPSIAAYGATHLYANEKQRKMIDDAPAWLKSTFWLAPIPGTDMVARIPKPFDIAPISNGMERAMDHIIKNDEKAFDGFARETLAGQTIPVMMTGLAPFIEGMANYSFFQNRNIIPGREQDLQYPDQHDINTSGTSRFIAEQINKVTNGEGTFKNFGSPRIIENTYRGLTGGLGSYATSIADKAFFNDFYNRADRPSKDTLTEQTPLQGFLVNEMGTGQSMSELYDLRDKLTREKGSAEQNRESFTEGGKLRLVNNATERIGKISKRMRQIENDENMSGDLKRKRLEELNELRNKISRQAWDRIK